MSRATLPVPGLLALTCACGCISAPTARAAYPLYAAVATGSSPGIYKVVDLNADGDARDRGEVALFAVGQKKGFIDVAVDAAGVVFAIEDMSGVVYRIRDNNGDGDALDSGEVAVYRGGGSGGIPLMGNLSLAVTTAYDPYAAEHPGCDTLDPAVVSNRTIVYVADQARQSIYKLEDQDCDNDAQSSNEISLVHEVSSGAPFMPSRMVVDDVGRVMASVSSTGDMSRLDDLNGDDSIQTDYDSAPRCAPTSCGPTPYTEFKSFPIAVNGSDPLRVPFGIARDSDSYNTLYATDLSTQVLYRIRDTNRDEDGQDSGETSTFYRSTQKLYGVVTDGRYAYVNAATSGATTGSILRLYDANGNGSASDSGEYVTWASISGGVPIGLALQRATTPAPKSLTVTAGIEESDGKDLIVVVEDGQTSTVTLKLIDAVTGVAVTNTRVGFQVASGCMAVCPVNGDRTDSYGQVSFNISRLETQAGEPAEEYLKFWAYGTEVFLRAVPYDCGSEPLSEAGDDQVVQAGDPVTLDGSSSTGRELLYCWSQLDGPETGLLETEACSSDPTAAFTAPPTAGDYTFELLISNGCEQIAEDAVVVTVE